MWFVLVVAAVAAIYEYYALKKPNIAITAKPGTVTGPIMENGAPIPVVFGTVNIKDANCVYMQVMGTYPVIVSGVTVGYSYVVQMRLALCHGKLDKVLNFSVNDRIAAAAPAGSSRMIAVNSQFFGGPTSGGGLSADVSVSLGAASTGVNDGNSGDVMEDPITGYCPQYFGIATAAIINSGFGNTAVIPPISIRGQRIHTRQCGTLPQWYDAKSAITDPYANNVVALLHLDGTFEDSAGKHPWGGTDPASVLMSSEQSYSGGKSLKIVGWKAMSPVDSASTDWAFGTGDFTLECWIYPTADGSFLSNGASADGVMGWGLGLRGGHALRFRFGGYYPNDQVGSIDVPYNEWSHVAASRINGVTKLFVKGHQAASYPDTHNFTSLRPPMVGGDSDGGYFSGFIDEVRITKGVGRYTTDFIPGEDGQEAEMNPIHIIRECLTDRFWGKKEPETRIDDTAFMAAADTCYNERCGISLEWNKPDASMDDFISEILKHINGVLYVEPSTGLWTVKLIRQDYAIGSIPVLDSSNIVKIDQATRKAAGDLVNAVIVDYISAVTEEAGVAMDFNQALIQKQGALVTAKVSYPGFRNYYNASKAATRDLLALSRKLFSCTITANRTAATLRLGSPFALTWGPYQLAGLPMRVMGIKFGDGVSNAVLITACEDVFASPSAGMSKASVAGWVAPSTAAPAPTNLCAIETPYYVLVKSMSKALVDVILASDSGASFVLAASSRPSVAAVSAKLYRALSTVFTDTGSALQFCPACTLAGSVTVDGTMFTYTADVDMSRAAAGDYALLVSGSVQEFVRLDSIDLVTKTLSIARGALDTVPSAFTAPTLYCLRTLNGQDPKQYAAGDVQVVEQICPVNSRDVYPVQAIGNPGQSTVVFAGRANKPYAPGNFNINGITYPSRVSPTSDLVMMWVHRDRTQQLADAILDYMSAGVGPETGVTYTLRIYGESGTLMRTMTGLAANSYTYDYATEGADAGGAGDPYWSNVVALLHLNTDFSDATGKSWASGAATISAVQKKFGAGSLLSTGSTTYREGPVSSDWAFGTGDFTVECWFYLTGLTTSPYYMIPFGNYNSSTGWGFVFGWTGSINFWYATKSIGGTTTIALNTWTHVAASRVSGITRLFVDGVLVATSPSESENLTATRAVRIGNSQNTSTDYLRGYIDEVRLTKGIGRYTATFTPQAAEYYGNLPGHRQGSLTLKLKAVRGTAESQEQTRLVRRPGYGWNYGYFYGGDPGEIYIANVVALLHLNTDFSDATGKSWASGAATISAAQKKFGAGSALFAANYRETADHTDFAFGNGDFTVECWLYQTARPSGSSVATVLGNWVTVAGVSSEGLSITIDASGHVLVNMPQLATWGPLGAPATIALNTWVHIAVSRVGINHRFFINGVLVDTFAPGHNFGLTGTAGYRLGADKAGTSLFAGYIDEVRITKGVGRYTAAFTPQVSEY